MDIFFLISANGISQHQVEKIVYICSSVSYRTVKMIQVDSMVWNFFPQTMTLLLRCKMSHTQRHLYINLSLPGHTHI